MIDKLLASCLGPVIAAEKQWRRRIFSASLFAIGTLGFIALFVAARFTGWWSMNALLSWAGLLTLLSLIGMRWIEHRSIYLRELARRVEEAHPDLRAALLAAMDQQPAVDGSLNFLQKKLLGEISEHAVRNQWVRQVSGRRLRWAGIMLAGFFVLFCSSFWLVLKVAPNLRTELAETEKEPESAPKAVDVVVRPGSVELKKGSRLLIEATFSKNPPGTATLVHQHEGGESRLEMQSGLDEHVFSLLLSKVDTDGRYHVEFGDGHSQEYAIKVFELPELLRADATITPPPASPSGAPETVIDTRKVSVMEGSSVEWRLKVNQQLTKAELRSKGGEVLQLKPSQDDPLVLVASHTPEASEKYAVHLVDSAGRENESPPMLTVTVRENASPKIKLTFPGRDTEASALQELTLEAEVRDDVGVLRAGMAYEFRGQEAESVLLDKVEAGTKKHSLVSRIDLEALEAKERDLVSYYFWAEDLDREGKVRRTDSDRFFVEVRLFDDILREGAPSSGSQESGSGNETGDLLRIQKDVINATWKLVRDRRAGKNQKELPESAQIVSESQKIVIRKTDDVVKKIEDAEIRQALQSAKTHMSAAAGRLYGIFKGKPPKIDKKTGVEEDDLTLAMNSATAAYGELLRARARETEISQSRNQSSASESGQEKQRNLNLELQQKDLKYEEQTSATPPAQTPEQKENLAILDRLKDLARRQEAILEKIKDLENQLQNAEGKEKEEFERQLKRLQEEQRKMLQETDELAETMDSGDNRADLSSEREQLRQTREDVREAAEKLESSQLADAANSATRAQSRLEEIKEKFREKTSSQFSQDMQSLREATRDLADKQKALSERAQDLKEDTGDSDSKKRREQQGQVAREMKNQGQKLAEVLDSTRSLSEQTETSEPLVSNSLYEAVRQAASHEIEESLEEGARMAQRGLIEPTRAAAETASRGITDLKERVEKAAERILGNEGDALRSARTQLDKLIEESKAEAGRMADAEKADRADKAEPVGQANQTEQSNGAKGKEEKTDAASQANQNGKAGRTDHTDKAAQTGTTNQEGEADKPFFEDSVEQHVPGPITGEDYGSWADRLADLGEILPQEELRNSVSRVRDAARSLRIDYRRDGNPPAVDTIQQKIVAPLLELKQRVSEELAKLNRENPLAPIDRDPVPGEFRDLVRRYYEELGAGK